MLLSTIILRICLSISNSDFWVLNETDSRVNAMLTEDGKTDRIKHANPEFSLQQ